MPERAVVAYHAGCPDGWCSAWVADRALRWEGLDVQTVAVDYGDPAPLDVAGADRIYIVDFSYPTEVLDEMAAQVDEVVVLDHHETARPYIEGRPGSEFDMDRSGAGITWDYFHPDLARPALVDYVEDRDLWRFNLTHSREINAYIRCLPHDLEAWDAAEIRSLNEMTALGKGAQAHVEAYCRAAASHAYVASMGGREFPIVNVTYESCSDVADYLLETTAHDMAGYFFERGDGQWQYGFRSRNGVTVNDFAAAFDGGGHPQAAGCSATEILHQRAGERES